MSCRSAAICGVLAVCALAAAPSATAQATPQALASEFMRAVAARDTVALRTLVHPASIESIDEERIEWVIGNWLEIEVVPGWTPRIIPLDSMTYDAATRSVPFGPVSIVFPIAPEQFLAILFTRDAGTYQVTSERTRDAIARDGDRWRLLIGRVERRARRGRAPSR